MVNKILIIHPEGNINNNPNLTGMVEILCENGYIVHIYSPKSEGIYQATPCKGAQLILFDNPPNSLLHGYVLLAGAPPQLVSKIVNSIWNKLGPYDLIIGVDRGIIEASVLAKLFKRPYGLISYEILFTDETSTDFKLPEIEACQGYLLRYARINLEVSCWQWKIGSPLTKFFTYLLLAVFFAKELSPIIYMIN